MKKIKKGFLIVYEQIWYLIMFIIYILGYIFRLISIIPERYKEDYMDKASTMLYLPEIIVSIGIGFMKSFSGTSIIKSLGWAFLFLFVSSLIVSIIFFIIILISRTADNIAEKCEKIYINNIYKFENKHQDIIKYAIVRYVLIAIQKITSIIYHYLYMIILLSGLVYGWCVYNNYDNNFKDVKMLLHLFAIYLVIVCATGYKKAWIICGYKYKHYNFKKYYEENLNKKVSEFTDYEESSETKYNEYNFREENGYNYEKEYDDKQRKEYEEKAENRKNNNYGNGNYYNSKHFNNGAGWKTEKEKEREEYYKNHQEENSSNENSSSNTSNRTYKYFDDCTNLNDLKKKYRQLAKSLHPDTGGDEKAFIDMNTEYDILKKILK